VAALAACTAIVITSVWWISDKTPSGVAYAGTIAQAEYPEMVVYPDYDDYRIPDSTRWDNDAYLADLVAWERSHEEQVHQGSGYEDVLDSFFARTAPLILGGSLGENRVYSPANIYMAISMLAELTEGASHDQLLALLDVENVDVLRQQASAVWNSNYCSDGRTTSVLANSVWVDDGFSVKKEVMKTLADRYYASAFQGDLQDPKMSETLQTWLNEQTGGLLEEASRQMKFQELTVMALASTLYYEAHWSQGFGKSDTYSDVFYSPQGEVTCEYMVQEEQNTLYWGEGFQAVAQKLTGSGAMWLILPEEGVSVDSLLTSQEMLQMVSGECPQEKQKQLQVNLHLPKFDVSAATELTDTLKNLGVTDVFDSRFADFSALTQQEDLFVSEVSHAARVMVDEDGCTAAAFTMIMIEEECMWIGDEVDLTFDRPFLFVITGPAQMPLFAGVVNTP
jgi:serpin B